MKNYYAILDVAKNASRIDIRRAYLKKAKLYHPDLNPSPSASARFKEVQEAYNTLYNDEKRRMYDQMSSFGRTSYKASTTDESYRRPNYRTMYENSSSFEDQFRNEAEQLRKRWQEMEADKLRREAERVRQKYGTIHVEDIRFFNSFSGHFFRLFLFFVQRLMPVLTFPLLVFALLTREVMSRNQNGAGGQGRVVYDSFGCQNMIGNYKTVNIMSRVESKNALVKRLVEKFPYMPRVLWWQANEILFKIQKQQRNLSKRHPCVETWLKLVKCMRRYPHTMHQRCSADASRHFQCTTQHKDWKPQRGITYTPIVEGLNILTRRNSSNNNNNNQLDQVAMSSIGNEAIAITNTFIPKK